jgi:3-phosphoshikimate 1-carboxyvinyltransferase
MSISRPHGLAFQVAPGGRLDGRLRVPGDKSISHRALMLGAIAQGSTAISGFLEGEDTLATLAAMRAMGVRVDGPEQGTVVVHGVGTGGLRPPARPLYLGNSGTSMRLLAGLLVGQPFGVTLEGDASLSRRPTRRISQPLGAMGAHIETSAQGTPPLAIRPVAQLEGIHHHTPVASAQVKSSVLLAGLYARGVTCVTEPAPSRDHTERMLEAFGCAVRREGRTVCVQGGTRLHAVRIDVPADLSSAAFFMVGASIAPDSSILLEHVGVNPTRAGIIDILRHMGADIEICRESRMGGEPVADIRVKASRLRGIVIPAEQVPLAIDEFPALFVAAACADGTTVLRGARELRVKESDRIQVMAEGLQRLGVDAHPEEDGMTIKGGSGFRGGTVESHNDHRIAMAFAMAGLRATDPLRILDCRNVDTSFPGFVSMARSAGLEIDTEAVA